MIKWRQTHLLTVMLFSLASVLFVRGWNWKTTALPLSKAIFTKPIADSTSITRVGRTNYIFPSVLLSQRANACTKYHRGRSLRQVVRAYQLAYAKYNLKPVTIKYERFDYGAQIQYLGKLRNTGSRFQVLTSFTIGASRDPHSSTGLDNTRIEICHLITPVPDTGQNDSLSTEDWEELARWYQKIYQIEAMISKKYPTYSVYESR